MSHHTPGPWRVVYEFNVFADERLVASTGGHSSSVNGEKVRNENVANALLVSAAPDLLAAAEAWLDAFSDYARNAPAEEVRETLVSPSIVRLNSLFHSAVAKARGQS